MLEKETLSGGTDILAYGISSHQGWRRTQEDAHFAVEFSPHCYLFGVFDGHGGAEVAQFCSRNMASELQKLDHFSDGDFHGGLREVFHRMDSLMRTSIGRRELDDIRCGRQSETSLVERNHPATASEREDATIDMLRRIMSRPRRHIDGKLSLDGENVRNSEAAGQTNLKNCGWYQEDDIQAGCTAVVALLSHRDLYIANAGDSRAVLSRGGKALALSNDHKPGQLEERERIVKAGGFLSDIGGVCRVNGNLNLSRAIGDLRYKNNMELDRASQIITAEPDVEHVMLEPEDRFLVLACDGVWDVMQK